MGYRWIHRVAGGGRLDWNGVDNLNGFNGFSPPYNDHL